MCEIQVINIILFIFVSCNESGYVFIEDLVCMIEVNWFIFQVYDGCNGEVLFFIGVINGVDLILFNGMFFVFIVFNGLGVY